MCVQWLSKTKLYKNIFACETTTRPLQFWIMESATGEDRSSHSIKNKRGITARNLLPVLLIEGCFYRFSFVDNMIKLENVSLNLSHVDNEYIKKAKRVTFWVALLQWCFHRHKSYCWWVALQQSSLPLQIYHTKLKKLKIIRQSLVLQHRRG